MVAPARQVAVRVLHRVEHDDAWAMPTLDAELRRTSLSREDAALATQIVYGTLRVWPDLDAAIERHAARPVKVDDWTHAALVSGAFQLLHLSRVPAHAVVDDAVTLVRAKRGPRVAGFVNAVLRRVADARPTHPAPPGSLVVPAWLDRALRASLGEDSTEALLQIGGDATSTDLRLVGGVSPEGVRASILSDRRDAIVEPTKLCPVGLRVFGAGDARRLRAHADGSVAVQEEGAQLIGRWPRVRAGDRVLDACAGRGGKTAQLLEAVGAEGHVVAADLHAHRLAQIREELDRMRLDPAHLEQACVDWTVGQGDVQGLFDHVLVDAPCTGLGTIRRRPEILLRIGERDAAQMGDIQRLILERAARTVRPGGSLVYAVCSPLAAEGIDVVETARLPGLEMVESVPFGLKSLSFGSTPPARLGPWVPGAGQWADAYQVFVWVHVG